MSILGLQNSNRDKIRVLLPQNFRLPGTDSVLLLISKATVQKDGYSSDALQDEDIDDDSGCYDSRLSDERASETDKEGESDDEKSSGTETFGAEGKSDVKSGSHVFAMSSIEKVKCIHSMNDTS